MDLTFKEILSLFPYRSETLTKYNESFLAAKKTFSNPEKNAEGTAGGNSKYEYAKIDQIYKAVEKSLHENSLYITHQVIALQKDLEILITTIMHISGEFMRDIRCVVADKPGNQGKGIANTYCRKYAILCMCSLSTFDDDAESEEEYLNEPIDKEILVTTIMHTSGEFMRDIRHLVNEKQGNQGRGMANTYCRKYSVLCLCALATTDDDAQAEDKYLDARVTAEQVNEIQVWCKEFKYGINEDALCKKFGVQNLYYLLNKQYSQIKEHVNKINIKIAEQEKQ